MNGFQKAIKIMAICLGVFIIGSILSSIISVISLVTDQSLTKGKNHSYKESYENIDNIEVDLSFANLIIKSGESFELETINVNDNFAAEKVNNTLILKEKHKMILGKTKTSKVIILVPKEYLLNKLNIDHGAGKLELDSIYAKDFIISQGAGTVKIDNSHFDNIKIDGGVGETRILDSKLNNLDLDSGVGNIFIESVISGNSKIDCGIGKIDLKLLGYESDYKISVSKGIGSITINKVKMSNDTTYGTGQNMLELDGGIGEISVLFDNNTPNID